MLHEILPSCRLTRADPPFLKGLVRSVTKGSCSMTMEKVDLLTREKFTKDFDLLINAIQEIFTRLFKQRKVRAKGDFLAMA